MNVDHRLAVLVMPLMLLVSSQPASALTAPRVSEAEVASCIHQAAQGKPWLEKTLWGLRDQEAGWIGAEVLNTNRSHDLGVLQINSGWVPSVARLVGRSHIQVRHWLRFDPCFNAETARWIFLTALGQTHDFWKAVGLYHSPTTWRQRDYAVRVAGHMQRRYGRQVFAVEGEAAPKKKPPL